MARIRSIKPGFFRHEELFEAERASGLPLRLSFAGLWTAADREGRFKWQPRALKLDCLPYDDVDFGRVLDELRARGFIKKYVVHGAAYGFIPGWQKHQIINNREVASDLPEPTGGTIDAARALDACATRAPRDTEMSKGKGREGKGTGMDSRTRETRPTPDEKYQEFKKVYPRRKGADPNKPARQLFDAAVKSGTDPEAIISAAKAGVGFDREKIGTEYIPQKQKWLRDRRWEDQPEVAVGTNGSAAEATIFIPIESPQWGLLAARWREESRASTGPPAKDYPNGLGWYFPKEWTQAAAE